MKIMYSTLHAAHNPNKAIEAAIPEHAAVFVEVQGTMFRLTEEAGVLAIRVERHIIVQPRASNTVYIRQEKF